MSNKSSTPEDVDINPPLADEDATRISFFDWFMKNALWIILVPYGVTLLIYLEALLRLGPPKTRLVISRGYDDLVYQTIVLTVLIMAWRMKALFQDISSTLQRLLAQKIISEKKEGETQHIVQVFWRWHRHWSRYILIAVFVVPILWFNYEIIYTKDLNRLLPGNAYDVETYAEYATEVWLSNLVTSIGVVLAFFLVGNWIFELIITARIISRAPKYFELEIQPSHPDKSGGFKVVGDLCLKMVYVVLIPTILFSFWLVASRAAGDNPEIRGWVPEYLSEEGSQTPNKVMVGLWAASGIVVFFWPMYTIHRRMLDERTDLGPVLDNIAHRIQELNRKLINDPDTISIEDNRKQTLSDIESLKVLYEHFRKVPTWPFERSVLIKFVTTQTVPVISFLGLGSGPLGELLDIFTGG